MSSAAEREKEDIQNLENLTSESREEFQQMLEWTERFSENLDDEQRKAQELKQKLQEALEITDELGNLEKMADQITSHINHGRTEQQSNQAMEDRYGKSIEQIYHDTTQLSVITGRIKQLYKDLHPEVEENEEVLEHMIQNDMDIGKKLQNAEQVEEEIQKLRNYHSTGERSVGA